MTGISRRRRIRSRTWIAVPDVAATLAEIAYAYDTLKVEGVGRFTSYCDRARQREVSGR
jgi:hypothetical protein